MKVLVLGGSGFLGSHVADVLTEKGHEVTIFDLVKSPYLRPGQKMIVGNILDYQQVLSALEGMEIVYNLAGLSDLNQSVLLPFETIQTNIMGNTNILEAIKKTKKIKRYFYASTVYVYSDKGSFYGVSKKCSEKIIEEYGREFSIPYTIIRYGSVYGPRADEKNRVYRILKEALSEGKITFKGDGQEEREYIHVRDAAMLSTDLLNDEYENQHIILTGVERFKYSEFLTMINEILGNKISVEYQNKDYRGHYTITPYSFDPVFGKKLVNNLYVDLGQGLIEMIQQIHKENSVK